MKKINIDNNENDKYSNDIQNLNFEKNVKEQPIIENENTTEQVEEEYKIVNSKNTTKKYIILVTVIGVIILYFIINAIYTKTQKSVPIESVTNFIKYNNNLIPFFLTT